MTEDLSLDEADDSKLLNLLWDTQVYLYEKRPVIKEIASLLCVDLTAK